MDIADWTQTIREDGRHVATFSIPAESWDVVHKSMFVWNRIVLWAGILYDDNHTKITKDGRPIVEVTGARVEFGPASVVGALKKLGESISTSSSTKIRGYHTASPGYGVCRFLGSVEVTYNSQKSDYAKSKLEQGMIALTTAGFVVEKKSDYVLTVAGWAT